MKTHTTQLLNKECLLIEMPKNAKGFHFTRKSYFAGKNSDSNKFQLNIGEETIELENVELIDLLSELTSDNVEPLVFKAMNGHHYKNYAEHRKPRPDYAKLWCKTALQSFYSALEAEGIYLNENPIEYPKQGSYEAVMTTNWESLDKQWNEAQQRTFDKTRTILLIEN